LTTEPLRILVGGSADWSNSGAIASDLLAQWVKHGRPDTTNVTVDSKEGAPAIVERVFAAGQRGFELHVVDSLDNIDFTGYSAALFYINGRDTRVEAQVRRARRDPATEVVVYRVEQRRPERTPKHRRTAP